MSLSHPRGTSNSNSRGSSTSRRARRHYLLASWGWRDWTRCFHCGKMLVDGDVTADRIIPGILGGTYARGNLRPACLTCNSVEGSALRDALKRGHDFWKRPTPTLRRKAHTVRWNGGLNRGQVATITYLLADGRFSPSRIAYEVGCSAATVRRMREMAGSGREDER
jgi:hypothetical protein